MNWFVGIDPDKEGGIAWSSAVGLFVVRMPIQKGTTGRAAYDVQSIAIYLRTFSDCPLGSTIWIFVEMPQKIPTIKGVPGGAVFANFARGEQMGFEWLVAGLNAQTQGAPFRLQYVPPKVWKRAMLAGAPNGLDPKVAAVRVAQRIFPDVCLLPTERSKKPSHGMAEALLIMEYGRRLILGKNFIDATFIPA